MVRGAGWCDVVAKRAMVMLVRRSKGRRTWRLRLMLSREEGWEVKKKKLVNEEAARMCSGGRRG